MLPLGSNQRKSRIHLCVYVQPKRCHKIQEPKETSKVFLRDKVFLSKGPISIYNLDYLFSIIKKNVI